MSGSCPVLMENGRYADAADVYGRMAGRAPAQMFEQLWLLDQAQALQSAGRIADAEAIYQRLATEHADTFIGEQAAERMVTGREAESAPEARPAAGSTIAPAVVDPSEE